MALRKEFSMQQRTEKKAYEMCNTRNTKIIEKNNHEVTRLYNWEFFSAEKKSFITTWCKSKENLTPQKIPNLKWQGARWVRFVCFNLQPAVETAKFLNFHSKELLDYY